MKKFSILTAVILAALVSPSLTFAAASSSTDLYMQEECGNTPLHIALKYETLDLDKAHELLREGANPFRPNNNGVTALNIAESTKGRLEAKLRTTSALGNLQVSAIENKISQLTEVINSLNPYPQDECENIPLHKALKYETLDLDRAHKLLRAEANPLRSKRDVLIAMGLAKATEAKFEGELEIELTKIEELAIVTENRRPLAINSMLHFYSQALEIKNKLSQIRGIINLLNGKPLKYISNDDVNQPKSRGGFIPWRHATSWLDDPARVRELLARGERFSNSDVTQCELCIDEYKDELKDFDAKVKRLLELKAQLNETLNPAIEYALFHELSHAPQWYQEKIKNAQEILRLFDV